MSSSSSPRTTAASIPNITALRNLLDYGDPRLPRCATFNDDTRAFRGKFRTSRGIAGLELHDWKSRDGQAGLTEMTIAYLEKEGSGLMFWPDDASSPNYNKYQYSKDSSRIKRLVKQLFFRLNQQQFRNHKYKHKEHSGTKARGDTQRREKSPIDVDAIILGSGTKLGNKPSVVAGESVTSDIPDFGQWLDEHSPSPGQVILNDANVYEVPIITPPPSSHFQSINQPSKVKRGSTSADKTPKGQQAKRQKMQAKLVSEDKFDATSREDPGGKWKSPRTRRQPQREGYCGLDEINKRIGSEKVLSPEQDGLQRSSTPESATITFRGSNTDDTRPPWPTPVTALGAETTPAPEPLAELIAPTRREPPQPATRQDGTYQPHEPAQRTFSDSNGKSPTPASSTGKLAAAGVGGTSSTTTANKPSVNFSYRVVLTRKPKTITERWSPRGRFQDKTLAELLKELPFGDDLLPSGDDSQGLIFTIESECMRTVERLAGDDEEGFASMKRYINMEIREWFARRMRAGSVGKGRLDVDVLIDRIASDEDDDEAKGRVGGLLEDLELDW